MMGRARIATAAALWSLGSALACALVVPHLLDPAPLGVLLLATTGVLGAAVVGRVLDSLGLAWSAAAVAILLAALAVVAAAGVALVVPPELATDARWTLPAVAGATLGLTALVAVAWRALPRRPSGMIVAVCLVVAGVGVHLAALRASAPVADVRCLLIGLDGTTWRVAKPLVRAGRMPAMSRIVREGSVGLLRSDEPTLSPRVWTTIATGKTPSHHRILDFETPQSELRAARVWDILEAEGQRVGIFGYLVTWPPGRHRGFLVPGWEARGPETSPPELEFLRHRSHGLRERLATGAAYVAYGVRVGSLADAVADVVRYRGWTSRGYPAAAALAQLRLESDVFVDLLGRQRPAFATFVATGSDTVSHLYWADMDAAHFPDVDPDERARYGDVIPHYYEAADRVLARLRARIPATAHVVVVSDHGNGPLAGFRDTLSVDVPRLVARLALPPGVSGTTISGTAHLEAPSAETLDAVKAKLDAVTWAGSGAPVFAVETLGATVLKARARKPSAEESQVVVGGQRVAAGEILREGKFSGDHTPGGIVLAAGPRIRAHARIHGARIRDVTPTLLALFELPPGDDMDGHVLAELFVDPIHFDRRVASYDDRLPSIAAAVGSAPEEVRQRLKALGYL